MIERLLTNDELTRVLARGWETLIGLTCDEEEAILDRIHQGLSPRFTELRYNSYIDHLHDPNGDPIQRDTKSGQGLASTSPPGSGETPSGSAWRSTSGAVIRPPGGRAAVRRVRRPLLGRAPGTPAEALRIIVAFTHRETLSPDSIRSPSRRSTSVAAPSTGSCRHPPCGWPTGHIKLTPAETARLARIGLKRALPDIWILYFGLWLIELKRPGGKLSRTRVMHTRRGAPRELIGQEEMFPRLLASGAVAAIAVCTSVDEVLATIRRWGIPLRGM